MPDIQSRTPGDVPRPVSRRLHQHASTIRSKKRNTTTYHLRQRKKFHSSGKRTNEELSRYKDHGFLRKPKHRLEIQLHTSTPVWRSLGTTNSICQRRSNWKPDTGDNTFNTVLCEAKNFMNARPITTVPVNAEDIEPLTPNHILIGRTHASFPLLPLELFSPEKQLKFAQQLTNHIWK